VRCCEKGGRIWGAHCVRFRLQRGLFRPPAHLQPLPCRRWALWYVHSPCGRRWPAPAAPRSAYGASAKGGVREEWGVLASGSPLSRGATHIFSARRAARRRQHDPMSSSAATQRLLQSRSRERVEPQGASATAELGLPRCVRRGRCARSGTRMDVEDTAARLQGAPIKVASVESEQNRLRIKDRESYV